MTTRSAFSFRYGVFDNDGTLVDTMGHCGRIFAETLAPYGIAEEDARSHYFSTTGRPMAEQYGQILSHHGIEAGAALFAALRDDFGAKFLEIDAPFFPGAKRCISALADAGLMLFVSSAASDACTWKRIAGSGVADRFTLAYGSSALPKGPLHLAAFAKIARVSIEEFAGNAFLCGDGEADMAIANAAGMYAIGVDGTVGEARIRAAGARRVVTAVGELLADAR